MNASSPSIESDDSNEPVLGIVCALNLEISPFLKRTVQFKSQSGNGFTFRACRWNDTKICIVEGGSGRTRAQKATNALIDAFSPPWIISAGFSGSLTDDLKFGHLVVADQLMDRTGTERLKIDLKMSAAPERGLHVGGLVSVNEIVRLVSEKREIAAATGAIAVDMESLAVAEVCRDRTTKFMAVRVISDDLSADLPPEVLAIFGGKGTIRAGALLGSVLKRPGCVQDLWAMREKAMEASEKLGAFLPGIIDGLAKTLPST